MDPTPTALVVEDDDDLIESDICHRRELSAAANGNRQAVGDALDYRNNPVLKVGNPR